MSSRQKSAPGRKRQRPTQSEGVRAKKKGATSTKRRVQPDPRLVKALSHPLRMRLLARFNEDVLSPAELAREFEISLPLISYHVKTLHDLDCIELVSTTPVRGAVEHHYRATRRALYSEQEWAALGIDAKQSLTGAVLRDAVSDALDALQSGDMDRRSDRHISFTTLDLDEQAWSELNEKLEALVYEALQLQADVAGRRAAGTDEDDVRTRLTILHYAPVPERPSTGVEPARRRTTRRPKKR